MKEKGISLLEMRQRNHKKGGSPVSGTGNHFADCIYTLSHY